MLDFSLYSLRFTFEARELIAFPPGKAANLFRGAFGTLFRSHADGETYARLFQPTQGGKGPSGLADWPRPFVFRAAHLDGCVVAAGERFHFDLHLFDTGATAQQTITSFISTFEQLAREGLGPRRSRADLIFVTTEPLTLDLSPDASAPRAIKVTFVTPAELKAAGRIADRPEFAVLFGRARDRIATLRALYGEGELEIDFKATSERAAAVRLERCDLRHVEIERRSTRTGQTHSLGGFTGEVEYSGDLGEFLPWLRAAYWTGVGRQTVWGKGVIEVRSA